MSDNTNWFDPSNLAAQDQASRASDPDIVRGKGDFGSYALANRGSGLQGSGIEHHNLVHAEARAELYRQIFSPWQPASIADLGCGLGMTSNALAQAFPNADITGFEVSGDAVAFANRSFPRCRFTQKALAPDSDLGRTFELVLCQEFYPFTRTGEWNYHEGFIKAAMNHVAPGGRLVIVLSERDSHSTILNNRDRLSELAGEQAWHLVQQVLPFDRVFRRLPILAPARIASTILGLALKRDRNVMISLSRRVSGASA